MTGMRSVTERIEFVHQHSDVKFSDKTLECGKNSSVAKDMVGRARARAEPTVSSLHFLNIATINTPLTDKDTLGEIDSLFKRILHELDLTEDDKKPAEEVSKKMKVVYKEGVGRHVIATKDIAAGFYQSHDCIDLPNHIAALQEK